MAGADANSVDGSQRTAGGRHSRAHNRTRGTGRRVRTPGQCDRYPPVFGVSYIVFPCFYRVSLKKKNIFFKIKPSRDEVTKKGAKGLYRTCIFRLLTIATETEWIFAAGAAEAVESAGAAGVGESLRRANRGQPVRGARRQQNVAGAPPGSDACAASRGPACYQDTLLALFPSQLGHRQPVRPVVPPAPGQPRESSFFFSTHLLYTP